MREPRPSPTTPIERRARGLVLFSFSPSPFAFPASPHSPSFRSLLSPGRSRVSSTLSLFLLARARAIEKREVCGPSSMRHRRLSEVARYFEPTREYYLAERCRSRAKNARSRKDPRKGRDARAISRNHSRFDTEAGLPYRSDRFGDFGARLPIGHASEPRTCSHGRSRSGTRGPQYLTHGSQSDYQIKVGRADARAGSTQVQRFVPQE